MANKSIDGSVIEQVDYWLNYPSSTWKKGSYYTGTPKLVAGQKDIFGRAVTARNWGAIGSTIKSAVLPAASGFFGVMGAAYGMANIMLTPREEYEGRTLVQEGSRQYGQGLLEGEGSQYIANIEANAMREAAAKAQAYYAYAPYYQRADIEREWAVAQAKAEAYRKYSPYYSDMQLTQSEKSRIKMLHKPRFI